MLNAPNAFIVDARVGVNPKVVADLIGHHIDVNSNVFDRQEPRKLASSDDCVLPIGNAENAPE